MLGRSLAQASIFGPIGEAWADRQGFGLLSRLPINGCKVIPLESSTGVDGKVMSATIELADQRVQLQIPHFTSDTDPNRKTEALLDCLLGAASPTILLGDFELSLDNPQFQSLLATGDVRIVISQLQAVPNSRRAPWMVLRGLDASEACVQPTPLSCAPLFRANVRLQ